MDYFNLHYFLWGNLTRKSNKLKVESPLGTDCVRLSRVHCICVCVCVKVTKVSKKHTQDA